MSGKSKRKGLEREESFDVQLSGCATGSARTTERVAQRSPNEIATISGGNDERVPPVPIPNTAVKPLSADGTWLDTARESRSPPDSIRESSLMALFFFLV